MPVNTPENIVQYNGDTSTTNFNVEFPFLLEADLVVTLTNTTTGLDTLQILNSDYTVEGEGTSSGGTVIFSSPPATGNTVTIERIVPLTQESTFLYLNEFPTLLVQNALDKQMQAIQQIGNSLESRVLRFPSTDPTGLSSLLPNQISRKGKYLYFDATNGEPAVAVLGDDTLALLDEDDMVSDSDTDGATQQSIKAYVDSRPLDEDDFATDSNTQPATQQSIGAFVKANYYSKNLLINANPMINQLSYTSGTNTTGANEYTLDKWRVVTSGQSITFADSAGIRTVTAPAGGVEQVIAGEDVQGGTYVISWTGTATCTVGGVSRSSGDSFTLTGGADVTVRFTGGTFSLPQLEIGNTPTNFEFRPQSEELSLCQSYMIVYDPSGATGNRSVLGFAGVSSDGNTADVGFTLPVTMRSIPTMSTVGTTGDFKINIQGSGSFVSTTDPSLVWATTTSGLITFTESSHGETAGDSGIAYIEDNSNGTKLIFDANL